MSAFLLLSLVLFIARALAIKDFCQPSACGSLNATDLSTPASRVSTYCHVEGLKMEDRCCRNGTVIVGLDLRNCSLNGTTILKHDIYRNSTVILDLTENPALESIDEDDFDGYTMLDQLFLDRSANVSCPGGKSSWNVTDGGDNDTVACVSQLDTCIETGFTCPNSIGNGFAHCESHGPGRKNLYCVCQSGHHGYKCLRQGTFPLTTFCGGLFGATAGMAGFLWVTNRRLVK